MRAMSRQIIKSDSYEKKDEVTEDVADLHQNKSNNGFFAN